MEIVNVAPDKYPGQRSLGYEDAYLARFIPGWYRPPTYDGNAWRQVVEAQPVATTCKESLIASILSLDWKIVVRDSKLQDELAPTIRYYTRLFEKTGYGLDLDYTSHVEWIAADILDTPFGGAAEIGRKGDDPNGRVQWVEPLDSATLYPTLNHEFPVVQRYGGNSVAFPKHAVARVYLSPRTRIDLRGWGMSPPEKAYLALTMLARGDTYYANLLLDIPTTGILDLGDMEKESALEWVGAYKSLLANGGNSSFKIPVLYEHQNDVKFVPFGKVPNDIMFDSITMKYAALVAAAYGMSLSDIGINPASSGGDTLAGSIRSERKTRKTGFARLKKKLKYYFEQILPDTLQFHFVDYDDEVNVALGRARLANSSAFKTLKDAGFIDADEGRQQLIADGMFTINMPEKAPTPEKEAPAPSVAVEGPNKKWNMMGGNPVPASEGGHGEVKKYALSVSDLSLKAKVAAVLEQYYSQLVEIRSLYNEDNMYQARDLVDSAVLSAVTKSVVSGWLVPVSEEYAPFMGKAELVFDRVILKELSGIILSDNDIDFSDTTVYDMVLKTVSEKVQKQFDEIVSQTISALVEE